MLCNRHLIFWFLLLFDKPLIYSTHTKQRTHVHYELPLEFSLWSTLLLGLICSKIRENNNFKNIVQQKPRSSCKGILVWDGIYFVEKKKTKRGRHKIYFLEVLRARGFLSSLGLRQKVILSNAQEINKTSCIIYLYFVK